MNTHIEFLIESLKQPGGLSDEQREWIAGCGPAIANASWDEVAQLVREYGRADASSETARQPIMDVILSQFVARQRQNPGEIPAATRDDILLLYNHLGEDGAGRWRLLQWLATAAHPADLRALADLVVDDPPRDSQAAALALTPLFTRHPYDASALFPHLLEALQHVNLAAPILDLSNYLVRSGRVTDHPARPRGDELTNLLGNLVQQLACVEESPDQAAETPEQLSRKVDECVGLTVALCDALALIGSSRAIGKLYQAMGLSHRRIRTEAAAALARLGEQAGIDELVRLAAEPVARLRVLANAEELGFSDRIDPQYTTESARAEAQVALELAQPAFFGLAPGELELIDSRTLYWPGYDEPIQCFLFRYAYRLESARYGNIAIAGPLVHAFAADLSDLAPDDIYAAYAGWHVEHENIYEVPLDAPSRELRAEVERLERRLHDDGYASIQSVVWGSFFGDGILVARATRDGAAGSAVVDQQSIEWYPQRTAHHPIGPHEAYCIYKGRRLLKSFNH